MSAGVVQMCLGQLDQVAVRDLVDEVPPLRPGEESHPIIVVVEAGGADIVDGYHRAAGMLRWCRERGASPARMSVVVVVVTARDDPDLVGQAADPGFPDRQRGAIGEIYRRAGLDLDAPTSC